MTWARHWACIQTTKTASFIRLWLKEIKRIQSAPIMVKSICWSMKRSRIVLSFKLAIRRLKNLTSPLRQRCWARFMVFKRQQRPQTLSVNTSSRSRTTSGRRCISTWTRMMIYSLWPSWSPIWVIKLCLPMAKCINWSTRTRAMMWSLKLESAYSGSPKFLSRLHCLRASIAQGAPPLLARAQMNFTVKFLTKILLVEVEIYSFFLK